MSGNSNDSSNQPLDENPEPTVESAPKQENESDLSKIQRSLNDITQKLDDQKKDLENNKKIEYEFQGKLAKESLWSALSIALGSAFLSLGLAISFGVLEIIAMPSQPANWKFIAAYQNMGIWMSIAGLIFICIGAFVSHNKISKYVKQITKIHESNLEEKPKTIKMHDNCDTKTKEHSRLANFTTAVLIGIVFTLVICNVWLSYEESLKEYSFPALEILKPITLTAYQNYDDGSRDLVYNQTKPAYLNVSYVTTSLSALNPIKVKATLDIRNINDTQWEGMPSIHIITYPGSYIYNDDWNFQDNAPIVLEKVPNLHQYTGQQTIVFPFAGDYRYAVLSLDDASDIEVSSDGKYTISKAVFTNIHKKVLENSKIVIEPSSSAATVKLAYLAQALAWIVIGIGILQLRKQLIRGILWVIRQK